MKLTIFYTNTKDYMKEFIRYTLRKLIGWGYIVGVAGLVMAAVFFKDGNHFKAGIMMTAGIMSLAVALFTVPLSVRDLLAQEKKLTGDENKVMLRFLDDAVELHQGKAHLSVEYRHVIRVAETKSLYILQIGKHNGVYIPKDAVKEENRDTFNALLEKLKKQTKKHGN